ncbi:DUF7530 family protein [Geoglobus acetivorans]|uniref:Pyridoxamine 5'-phosphate oxidase family protein n=1 Tax=Geoglobus acetivorans TaxID=565033 RepID=A0ABZ3H0R0_GEOAI|nr:pyridoxamine 5'-phosphate oxidase family protein [Geoglobus acetivorans]
MEKWVYELIIEKIPPFSLISDRNVVLVQLLLMLAAGILIAILAKLPLVSLLMGSLAILVVVVWSRLTLIVAPSIRSFRPSMSEAENVVIEEYKQLLFSRRRPELFTGILIFIPFLYRIFTHKALLEFYHLENWIVILFALILAWDVVYRAGIGIWVFSLSLFRSYRLFKLSKRRKELEHVLLYDLKAMESIDRRGIAYAFTSLMLYPVLSPDKLLASAVLAYFLVIFLLSSASVWLIRMVPWLPPDIMKLLEEAKFAYVGHNGDYYPHVTPVVQVFDGRSIYFFTSRKSKKLRLIEKDNTITVVVDVRDSRDFFNNRAVMISGKAKPYYIWRALFNLPKILKLFYLTRKKYSVYLSKYRESYSELPEAWKLTPFLTRIPIEVEPERVIYWRGARKIRIGL